MSCGFPCISNYAIRALGPVGEGGSPSFSYSGSLSIYSSAPNLPQPPSTTEVHKLAQREATQTDALLADRVSGYVAKPIEKGYKIESVRLPQPYTHKQQEIYGSQTDHKTNEAEKTPRPYVSEEKKQKLIPVDNPEKVMKIMRKALNVEGEPYNADKQYGAELKLDYSSKPQVHDIRDRLEGMINDKMQENNLATLLEDDTSTRVNTEGEFPKAA